MNFETSLQFAIDQDQNDPLKKYRSKFHIPKVNGKESIYFTGNSLGLQPKSVKSYIDEELSGWATLGVEGHFHSNKRPWFEYHKFSKQALAKIVGAKPEEVVSMNNLTSNLHFMLVSFYRPTKKRFKIITESGAFPSDQYVLESQARHHGLDPEETIVEISPRKGEHILRTEDIIQKIEETGEELALVMMGGIQYYTGQLFEIKEITIAAHQAGAFAGFDLAHAAGNVVLNLHDDGPDFAAWCSYKYLNSGPGNVSAVFVHERHHYNNDIPRFAGWWGYDEKERFKMKKGFKPMKGADGWQLSNVNVIGSAAHLAALEIFEEVGMQSLREKSLLLTGYMEFLLKSLEVDDSLLEIITPTNPEARGCQLSLLVKKEGKRIFEKLSEAGIIVDWREPNVIRAAPTPLYNKFEDVFTFVELLRPYLT